MFTDRVRQILVVVFAIGQFVTPIIFATNFDNSPPGSPIYFVPADYTFVIWSVIVFLSATYATYQLRPSQTERTLHRRVGWPVMINTVFFSAWIYAAQQAMLSPGPQQDPVWLFTTVLLIIGMLVANIVAFVRLRQLAGQLTRLDVWLVQIPIAVYFGWLSVAVIANLTAFLYDIGWSGTPLAIPVTLGLLLVAALITGSVILLFNIRQGAVAYSAVIIWACIGIAVQNLSQSVIVTAAALGVAVAILLVVIYRVNNNQNLIEVGVS